MTNNEKTPEQLAEKEVNKKIGSEIAKKVMEIRRYEAQIKRLNREIEKLKSGEAVPEVNSCCWIPKMLT